MFHIKVPPVGLVPVGFIERNIAAGKEVKLGNNATSAGNYFPPPGDRLTSNILSILFIRLGNIYSAFARQQCFAHRYRSRGNVQSGEHLLAVQVMRPLKKQLFNTNHSDN